MTDESTKSGLHIYGGEVTATHLTVDNRNTAGGAAVVLNGGQLDLNGTTTFQLGENSWGGINIDNRSNVDPVLNIANNATINVSSPLYFRRVTPIPLLILTTSFHTMC